MEARGTARRRPALAGPATFAATAAWAAHAAAAALAAWAACAATAAQAQPARLSQTGLFAPAPSTATAADPTTAATAAPGTAAARHGEPRLAADLIAFTPQYALWSDGAAKRRWLRLPPGTAIDARDVDAWRFPPGTQLWKEFAVAGRPVETRYIERRRDGRWVYATYAWNADGADADLVPAQGDAAWPVAGAPGGRYALPSVADCQACHESAAVPVLGFSAVQLSPARVPTDLRTLVAARRLRGLPARLLATPPRIAATSEVERAALGYLHANCGHCHNRSGHQAPLALTLAQRAADPLASRAEVLASTVNAASRFRMPDTAATQEPHPPHPPHEPHPSPQPHEPQAPHDRQGPHDPLIAPGDPARSLLVQRMATREPRLQMPPIGTVVPDPDGLALLRRWVTQVPRRAEPAPSPTAPERSP